MTMTLGRRLPLRLPLSVGSRGNPRTSLLFQYHVGDSLSGATFTRAATATYVDSAGVVQTAASGVPREAHYIGGVRHLLLENQQTNAWTYSNDLTQTVWGKDRITVTLNAGTAPDGTGTAIRIQEDTSATNNHRYSRSLPGVADQTQQTVSFHAKAGERVWVYVMTLNKAGTAAQSWINLSTGTIGTKNAAHTIQVIPLGNGWYRIQFTFNVGTGTGTVYTYVGLAPSDGVANYTGDGVSGAYVWGHQWEQDQPNATSYIATVAATVTRAGDFLWFPASMDLGEETAYLDATSLGTTAPTSSGLPLLTHGDGSDNLPRLRLYRSTTGGSDVDHQTPAGTVSALGPASTAPGARMELTGRLYGSGAVDTQWSADGGAVQGNSPGSTLPIVASTSPRVALGADPSAAGGIVAIRRAAIAAGIRSLDEMRELVGAPDLV